MDLSLVAAASNALSIARDLGRAAVGLRDFNECAAAIAQINEQLLKAQDSLFAHNTELFALQQEVFATREELRKAKETIAEHGKYALLEISPHVFVLRSRADLTPDLGGAQHPMDPEPPHYVCQPCLHIRSQRSVLVRSVVWGTETFTCPECKNEFMGTHVGE